MPIRNMPPCYRPVPRNVSSNGAAGCSTTGAMNIKGSGSTPPPGITVDRVRDLDPSAAPAQSAPEQLLAPAAPDLPGVGGTEAEAMLAESIGESRLNDAPPLNAEGAEILAGFERQQAGVASLEWPEIQKGIADGSLAAELGKKGKDFADFASAGADKLRALTDADLPKLEKQLANYTGLVSGHRAAIDRVNARVRGLTSLMASGNLNAEGMRRASAELAALTDSGRKLTASMERIEQSGAKLLGSLQGHQKVASLKTVQTFGKSVEEAKEHTKLSGRMMVGLDMALKFSEFQKQDPQNWGKNAFKAITSTFGKQAFDSALKGSKLSAGEASVGMLKFGLEMLGLKNSTIGVALDAASQAFPGDAAIKGVEQAIDQVHATVDWAKTGNPTEWLELDKRNLNGDNGAVLQGAAILGDLIATGGKNIPLDKGIGIDLAKSLGFWKEEIDPKNLGNSTEQKVALLGKLAEGSSTTDAHTRQMRAILNTATPHMAAQVLLKTDVHKLVDSMRVDGMQTNPLDANHKDPLALLVHGLNAQLRATADPGVRRILSKKLGEVLDEIGKQGKTLAQRHLRSMLDNGQLSGMPGSLRGQIRGYPNQ
ncbi:MAG: hypothetical protein R2729_28095 [Bryobacteraceae bacterium]